MTGPQTTRLRQHSSDPRTLKVAWAPGAIRAAERRLRELVHEIAGADGQLRVAGAGGADHGVLVVGDKPISWTDLACLADVAAAVLAELEPAAESGQAVTHG